MNMKIIISLILVAFTFSFAQERKENPPPDEDGCR
jgi:hypothetical protein